MTEEVSGVSRVVVWPAPQAAASAATERPAPPPGRKHLPALPPLDPQQEHHASFYRIPRGGDETEAEAGGGGRGRSRSRSRAIMERAKSFERAASSSGGQREVSRERRPLNKKRSPSGKQPQCIEILCLATLIEKKRKFSSYIRKFRRDWVQQSHTSNRVYD